MVARETLINALYWFANRSQNAMHDWNTNIFNQLALIDEYDYE
jgi:hypothetical protein